MSVREPIDGSTTFADLMFLLLLTILVVYVTKVGITDRSLESDVNPARTIEVICTAGSQPTGRWREDELWGPTVAGDSGGNEEGVMWVRQKDPITGEVMITTFFTGSVVDPGRFRLVSPADARVTWRPAVGNSNYIGRDITLEVLTDSIRFDSENRESNP